MLVESIGGGLLVGKARGGKISNISSGEIRGWYFIGASFLIEFSAVYFASKGIRVIIDGIPFIHLLSYILLFFGLFMNFDKYSFWIITVGVLLNFIVIMANGGQMPVSADALRSAGLYKNMTDIVEGKIITHTLINETTRLKILADILPLPKIYPRPKVYSLGDILMALGVFIYVQQLMLGKGEYGVFLWGQRKAESEKRKGLSNPLVASKTPEKFLKYSKASPKCQSPVTRVQRLTFRQALTLVTRNLQLVTKLGKWGNGNY